MESRRVWPPTTLLKWGLKRLERGRVEERRTLSLKGLPLLSNEGDERVGEDVRTKLRSLYPSTEE
jgi:hypothetical protein